MPEITRDQVIEYLSSLPAAQVVDLVRDLESKWGVQATPLSAAPCPTFVPGDIDMRYEQTDFTVELVDAGANKINVIKVVREVLGLGLKESKDLVDHAPRVLKEGISKADAEEIRHKLAEVGAKATVR